MFAADTDTCTEYCERAVSAWTASVSGTWSRSRCSDNPSQSGDDRWLSGIWPSLGRVSSSRWIHTHNSIVEWRRFHTFHICIWSITVSHLNCFFYWWVIKCNLQYCYFWCIGFFSWLSSFCSVRMKYAWNKTHNLYVAGTAASSMSLILFHQLEDKLKAHDLYLCFLKNVNLWSRVCRSCELGSMWENENIG